MSASTRMMQDIGEMRELVDPRGRILQLRTLAALERLRLFKALGSDLAQNEPYLGMSMLAASVAGIDGVPVPFPGNEAQIEALVQRLGDEGLAAVANSLSPAEPLASDTVGN